MIIIFTWLLSETVSCSYALSDVSDHTAIPSVFVAVNPTEEINSIKALQTTQTRPSKKFLVNIQTAATSTTSGVSQLNSSTGIKSTTEEKSKIMKSTATVTSQASTSTNPTRVSAIVSNFTQTKDTEGTSASHFVKDKITHPSKQSTQSTNPVSTATTSIKPEEKSESTSTVTDGDVAQPKDLYKTSVTTPVINITKVKKRQDPSGKEENSKRGGHHSRAVAGLIGGALALMMVGFLIIYIKKRKLQKQQITTADWAGPSPFLEGGADNDQVTLRSSTRISLSSILPQRLSKRLSLIPETDKELQDMTSGTTFGGKHQESTFGQEMDRKDIQQSNESAAVPQMKSTADTAETIENSK
uniref:Ecotropic viral integration site 2B n=2 Tax=Acanthochromis polyacanthus TaxID=80966 RepID=A0A3Q1F7T8_9TELE